jgi:hypothetical protein
MAALPVMLALTAANTAQQFAGQRRQATIAEQEGNFQGGQFDTNATLAEGQASDVIARGNQAAGQAIRGGRLLAGSQRAAYAAQGLDASVGSPAQVIANDRQLSELDALTIRNNALREAWGYRTEAASYRAQGNYARMAGRNTAKDLRWQSVGTLLSGAGQLFNTYQSAPKRVTTTGSTAPPVPWSMF